MDFARDEEPIRETSASPPTISLNKDAESPLKTDSGKCRFNKMDLIIILDASTSRENVFEHQRELALSLIERLPISAQDTHVATGINSFTSIPTLRQTLGLGRDRKVSDTKVKKYPFLRAPIRMSILFFKEFFLKLLKPFGRKFKGETKGFKCFKKTFV